VCLHTQPSLFLGIIGGILHVLEIQDINRIASVYFEEIGRYNCRRTPDLGSTCNHYAGVALLCERLAALD
jgi:hypothetical protein